MSAHAGTERPPRGEAERVREALLDAFVYVPVGLAVCVAEELPRLAALGRQRLGVRVSSARAIGEFAVRAGGHELRRLSGRPSAPPPPAARTRPSPVRRAPVSRPVPESEVAPTSPPTATPGRPAATGVAGAPTDAGPSTAGPSPAWGERQPNTSGHPSASHRLVNGNVPPVGSLAIPGFDTLSASQVVQRLDGLSREELVSVRAYETSTRARRTIINRVDQLLEERA